MIARADFGSDEVTVAVGGIVLAPEDVAERARRLKAAMIGAVNEQDMVQVMTTLANKAKAGELDSIRLLLTVLGAAATGEHAPNTTVHVTVGGEPEEAPPARTNTELIAAYIADRGPMRVAELKKATRLSYPAVQAAIAGPWFVATEDGYDLTPAGRTALILED